MNKLKRRSLLHAIDEFTKGQIPSETTIGTVRNKTDIVSEMWR
jgi:hypothetical protein